MSYTRALEAAGAKIEEFELFGDYQGSWWARVEYKGQSGWVCGSYGSCSGCDSFESEFDYSYHEHDDKYWWLGDPVVEGCDLCESVSNRLAAFGEGYLDNLMTQAEAEQEASRHIEWDLDAQKTLAFIKQHAIVE